MPGSRKAWGDGKMKKAEGGRWKVDMNRDSGFRGQASGFKVQAAASGRREPAEGLNSIANCKLQNENCKLRTATPSPLNPLPKGEGTMCENASGFVQNSPFIIHHSSFSLHPSSFIFYPLRRGISLMEVLISIFVLSIGLLGVAAIIPLGQMALLETAKADRSGACGRAAMREIQVSRLLDFRYWYWLPGPTTPPPPSSWEIWGYYPPFNNPTSIIPDTYSSVTAGITNPNPNLDSMPFVLDPLGRAKDMPEIFGFSPTWMTFLPRRTLRSTPLAPSAPPPQPPPPISNVLAEQLFIWNDDLPFSAPKNSAERPRLVSSSGGAILSEGSYSWFLTVIPAATEMSLPVAQRRLFNVSVVVCYKRNYLFYVPFSYPFNLTPKITNTTLDSEHTATISAGATGFPGMGIGGGTVQLDAGSNVNVKENEWVMLYHLDANPQLNRCYWYRVVGISATTNTLNLNGPDWDRNLPAVLVVVPGAIAVYTTTMELDWDPLWTK
jgi:hypothetical protein